MSRASYSKRALGYLEEICKIGPRIPGEPGMTKQQELLVKALVETDRLSRLRYEGGLDSFLQVLDADRNLFQGQLVQAQLLREELLAIVQLYRALGGGWS
jgi:hypothetical protein